MGNKEKRLKTAHDMPPLGTQLRGRTKGKDVYAQVVSDPATKTGLGILFECKSYRSMSGAARAATGHSVNGWQFWKVHKGASSG